MVLPIVHVTHSPNTSYLNSSAEEALSLKMALWWLQFAATSDPNPSQRQPGFAASHADSQHPWRRGGHAAPPWPAFPLDGRGGAMAEPVMVLETTADPGAPAGSNVVWGGRSRQCAFWDTVAAERTPED